MASYGNDSGETAMPEATSVFARFAGLTEAVTELRNALSTLCFTNYGGLMTLTIKRCNAASRHGTGGAPFSKTFVDVQDNSATRDEIYSFGTIFEDYLFKLQSFLKNPDTAPTDKTERLLFSKLLDYILDHDQQNVLQILAKKKNSECEVAAMLAEHVFSKLCVSPQYTLDKHYPNSNSVLTCGCGCKKDFTCHYGDTSVGNTNVWHGTIDIILGYQVPVEVLDEDMKDFPRMSSSELKNKKCLENPDITYQLISQAIVFSFLQRKNHPEYNTLIPSIGVSKSYIIFYFYDSEKDILLKSPSFPFLNNIGEVNVVTILATWFVVNYKFLCSGIQDKYFRNAKKANFFEMADRALTIYQNDLSIGGDIHADRTVAKYHPSLLTKCVFVSVDTPDEPPPAKKPNLR